MSYVLAIDPGNIESAYVVLDKNYKPLKFGKVNNEEMLRMLRSCLVNFPRDNYGVAIEMVASYGMAVGKSVFETCVWIGRFEQEALNHEAQVYKVYRSEEKMNLCHSMQAKDSNITQALIDRFAPNTPNKGKGSKKDPGFFYGFKADIWQAMAVGVTHLDWLKGVRML